MTVNLSTNKKTHYETLGISPNATHNEIKSAYYKLTVKYHPDKNKSESAKYMFQKISDAYNVLGNYKLRKQYDRNNAVKHREVNVVYKSKPTYKQDSDIDYEQRPKHKIFDFDEWTRAHYQETFEKDLRRRQLRRQFNEFKQESHKPKMSHISLLVFISILVISSIYIKQIENYDIPIDKREDK